MAQRRSRQYLTVALSLALIGLGACSEVVRTHGYAPSEEELLNLVVGVDTRGSVEDVIGKPSTSGVLSGGAWYYVGSRVRHYAYRKPEEIEREVVAITFAPDDTITNVERFGLEDGQVVALSRRVTETTIRDSTFLRQIIRNFGRIDLGEALSD